MQLRKENGWGEDEMALAASYRFSFLNCYSYTSLSVFSLKLGLCLSNQSWHDLPQYYTLEADILGCRSSSSHHQFDSSISPSTSRLVE